MKYVAEVYRKDGTSAMEIVEADDPMDAAEVLRKRGLMVCEVRVAGSDALRADADARKSIDTSTSSGKRLKFLTGFLRQMSVLVSTGTPLVEAISSLERQTDDPQWHGVLAGLRERMEEGRQLSEAMAAFPTYFDPVCRNLVAAGETGGILDVILNKLATLVRQQQRIRSEVIGAMAYPFALILISIAVLTAMIGFVLPRFEGLFKSLDRPVPASTRVLMDISLWLRDNWWAPLAAVIAIVVGAMFIFKTKPGRIWLDHALLRAPLMGNLFRSLSAAHVARVMGILVEGKVALLECLRLVQGTIGNSLYVRVMQHAQDAVTRGESAAAALSESVDGVRLFPPSVIEAFRSGERSGKVGPVLISVADALDEDNDVLLRATTRLLEPVILSVLGLIVGVVTLSMFMPLFDLAAAGPMSAGGGGAP